jgi:hypothetical protein
MPKTPPPSEPGEPGAPATTQSNAPGATRTISATSLAANSNDSLGCGDRTGLIFLDPLDDLEGIDPANLRTAGDAYYEGMLDRIGAFRAIDELVARFLGGLNITSGDITGETTTSGDLRSKLCNYMRQEPLRLPPEERDPVLRLFDDPTLERLLQRLADTIIAFDLSARPDSNALTSAAVPVGAARLAVIAAIEDLELFLDAKGGGGVCFVTNEVGRQLTEILQILDSPELRQHIPGNDIDDLFSVIDGLLGDDKDRPKDWEARQLARKASTGRKIFVAIADQIAAPKANADDRLFTDAEIDTIARFVYEWRAAHGCMYIDGVDDAADGQAADERRLEVIRLRRRVA